MASLSLSLSALAKQIYNFTIISWAKLKKFHSRNWKPKAHHFSRTEILNYLPPPPNSPNLHHCHPFCHRSTVETQTRNTTTQSRCFWPKEVDNDLKKGGDLFVLCFKRWSLWPRKKSLIFVLENFLSLPSRMFMLYNFLGFQFG